ncbi:ABC transporter permease [Sphingomonas hankookensis]|uniref:ABC transporter permease n=1 Tax=Sphingomonas hankookensis TaxID=563996 RepID=UPI003D3037A9
MHRFALLSLYRSLVRHRLHAALNIGGLAVGIAVFLILGLYVRFETGYETWLPDHDKTYVVQTVWSLPDSPVNGAYPYTMGELLNQMQQDFPGLVGTRVNGGERGGTVIVDGRATTENVAQVDAAFLSVLRLPLVAGNAATALAEPGSVAIDETTARKYFGDRDPIGQKLVVAVYRADPYRVTAVFRDLPANSDLKLSVLVPLPRLSPSENWSHWGSTSVMTYLRFDTPAAARAFGDRLTAFVDRRGTELAVPGGRPSDMQQLALLPIADLHFAPQGQNSDSTRLTVVTLGLVGVFTLLIAVVNYVNLATARAGLRAREVAMRKVLGADRATLVRQFLGEAVLTVAIAALGGLILAELGLPLVNAAGGLSLTIPYAVVVPALALLAVVVGVLAGVYPAILLSRFPAAAVLASARSPGGGRAGTRVREALVIGQFGLAIAFLIGTAVLLAQTRHVRASDLGFQRDGLLVVRSMADLVGTARPQGGAGQRDSRAAAGAQRDHVQRGHRRQRRKQQRQRAAARRSRNRPVAQLGGDRAALLRDAWRAVGRRTLVRRCARGRQCRRTGSGKGDQHRRQPPRAVVAAHRITAGGDRPHRRRRTAAYDHRGDRRPALRLAAQPQYADLLCQLPAGRGYPHLGSHHPLHRRPAPCECGGAGPVAAHGAPGAL